MNCASCKDVSSVTTILDVPLLLNSGVSLADLADEENIKTLEKSPCR